MGARAIGCNGMRILPQSKALKAGPAKDLLTAVNVTARGQKQGLKDFSKSPATYRRNDRRGEMTP